MPPTLVSLVLLLFESQSPVERAKALIEAGKLAEARAAIAGLNPLLPGLMHYRARQYPAAIESLTRATKAPESSATYRESVQMPGLSFYLSGRLKDAIPWLEKAAESGPRAIAERRV